jgi:hypothetical protein
MGRIKELFMQLYYANDGNIPEEATIADLQRMEDMKIFEWQEYERKRKKQRLQQTKSSNTKEIIKMAKVEDFWEAELKASKTGNNKTSE